MAIKWNPDHKCYTALSTDDYMSFGASLHSGMPLYLTDTQTWLISNGSEFVEDIDSVRLAVSDLEIGAVEIKDSTTNNRLVINSDGTINAKLIPIIGSVTIYNGISATPTTPTEIVLGNIDSVKIEITGTSTSRTITFSAKFENTSTPILIEGINLSTYSLANQTTGTSSEFWQFDSLRGFYSLVINPTVVSGGNLTIKAVNVS